MFGCRSVHPGRVVGIGREASGLHSHAKPGNEENVGRRHRQVEKTRVDIAEDENYTSYLWKRDKWLWERTMIVTFSRFGLIVMAFVFYAGAAVADFRVSVKVETANIRSGPGIKHNIIWKIEKHHPLRIIKQSGEWYHFRDYERDMGWIHKSLVGNTRTVIMKADNINIRSGPGTRHKVTFTAETGVSFKVLKRKGDWIHIRHADGDTGWVFKELVW